MLQVRSIYVNGDWETYQNFRIDQEGKRLYPFQELVNRERYPVAA